ncbi:hypothetical protein [Streptomyces sp. NPDC058964]|uniref:SCO2400 family protein n=1 Tax=Streptomyces sp. NPDC058964 TaxID=3346681 RepID=UPI003674B9DC
MDYCSSCRRHLNGALVCPGCGAYAPDIAPPATVRPAVPAWENPAASHGRHDFGPGDPATVAAPADEITAGTVEDAPPAPQGRAARRRQLARWKKNKRRAAVATAVAIVGGGLTVASLDRQSADRAQAATAAGDSGMGAGRTPVVDDTRTASAASGVHRSSRTPAPAQPTAVNAPRRQSESGAHPGAQPVTRPDAAATPRPLTTSAPRPRATPSAATGTPAGDTTGTGTTAQQPSTPASTAGTGTGSGTSQASPSPASTSPAELCLLVVCLG